MMLRHDTSNYDENDKRPLSIGKNKKVTGLFKDELGGRMDNNNEVKKSKGTKKCVIKRKLMFENYKDCLLNDKVILKLQQRFKSDYHDVYTEEIS